MKQTWAIEIEGEILDTLVVERTPELDHVLLGGLKESRPLAIAALLAQQSLERRVTPYAVALDTDVMPTLVAPLLWLVRWRDIYFSSQGPDVVSVPEMWLRIS